MTPRQLLSIIVVVASISLIVYGIQALRGDKAPAPAAQTAEPQRSADEVQADLTDAYEDVEWQASTLSILRGGPNQDAISADQGRIATAQNAIENASRDAYVNSKDAIKKTDPILGNSFIEKSITAKKKEIDNILSTWKNTVDAGNTPLPQTVQSYLSTIQSYLASLETLVDSLTPDNSGLTQAQIDSYKELVESAKGKRRSARRPYPAGPRSYRTRRPRVAAGTPPET